MDKKIFYQGQAVGCLMYGEGTVRNIISDKVRVEFKERTFEYNIDGRILSGLCPTLYPIEQYRAIIANLPAPQPEVWQPKPGEWCWFWEFNWQKRAAVLAKFIEINGGAFKAEVSNATWDYDNCAQFVGELPEHLKEVQP